MSLLTGGKAGWQKFRFGHRVHAWQTQTHQKMAGLETFCGMDIACFIIAQGLYLNEWKAAKKKEAEKVVHTRVLSQAVAGIMSLYVMTSLDKSLVPANGGVINVRMTNPFLRKMHKQSMDIHFDDRLHFEMQQNQVSLLSDRHRHLDNIFVVREHTDISRRCLVYKQQQEQSKSKAHSANDLPPVPMEACAHMLPHYYEFLQAERRLRVELPSLYHTRANGLGIQNHIATAVRIVGSNICSPGKPRAVENSMFLRVTATHMLTRTEAVEMPFVSTKFLYTCVVRTLTNGTFVIESCACDTGAPLLGTGAAYKPLPIAAPLTFQQEHFSFAVSHGLHHTRHNEVLARSPAHIHGKGAVPAEKLEDEQAEILGLLPFPVFYWPQLVVVSQRGRCCVFTNCSAKRKQDSVNQEVSFVMHEVEHLLQQDEADMFHLQDTDWLKLNPDIPALSQHMLLLVLRTKQPSQFGMTWRFVGFTHAAVQNRVRFDSPELLHILRTEGFDDTGKVFTFTAKRWQQLTAADPWLISGLHDQHYMHSTEGYWIPECVPDPRMQFWVSYTEDYDGTEQERYLWFDSRESLKHFAINHCQPDPDWTACHLLLVSPEGVRSQVRKTSDGFMTEHTVYAEDSFYRLRQQQDEYMDAICHYQKQLEASISNNQSQNEATCAARLQHYTAELSVTQERLHASQPKPCTLAQYEQPEQAIIASSPCIRGLGIDEHTSDCIGILRPHINGQYLQHGQYSIDCCVLDEASEEVRVQNCKLDFVSASYGMVPEGQLMFVRLNKDLYVPILKKCGGAFVLNESNHRRIMDNTLDVALACYYVLKHTKDDELFDSYITVMIEVNIQKDEEDDNFSFHEDDPDSKLLIRIPLFDSSKRLRISLHAAAAWQQDPHVKVVPFDALHPTHEPELLPVEWNLCRKTWEDDAHCEHEPDLNSASWQTQHHSNTKIYNLSTTNVL